MEKGAKTRSSEGPIIGNVVVRHKFEPVVESWNNRGVGLKLETPQVGAVMKQELFIHHVWWADNLFLLGSSGQMLQRMIHDATRPMQEARLEWKLESLQVLYGILLIARLRPRPWRPRSMRLPCTLASWTMTFRSCFDNKNCSWGC